jgi:hypothetical protein
LMLLCETYLILTEVFRHLGLMQIQMLCTKNTGMLCNYKKFNPFYVIINTTIVYAFVIASVHVHYM